MNVMLLMLSLILNIIALFAVILLFMRQNRFTEVEKKQERLMKEMEEMISNYLIEMKEENEDFIGKMQKVSYKQDRVPKTDKELAPAARAVREQVPSPAAKGTALQAARAYKQFHKEVDPIGELLDDVVLPPIVEEENPVQEEQVEEKSTYEQALELHNQGIPAEEIAKKLALGKTELDLILKFRTE